MLENPTTPAESANQPQQNASADPPSIVSALTNAPVAQQLDATSPRGRARMDRSHPPTGVQEAATAEQEART